MGKPEQSDPRLHFEYWSDPLCIWAFVAQPKLESLLREHGDRLAVHYRVVPVFGSVRWHFSEGPWRADGVEGRIGKIRAIARRFGHEVQGTVWREDPPASSWAPAAAIKAVFAMEAQGLAETGCGARYQWALRECLFAQDRNVARRSVQLELASQCDIPLAPLETRLDDGSAQAALWEDHRAREHLGIQGSPTYVFDSGRSMLYGNVTESIIAATVGDLLLGIEAGRSQC